MSTQLLWIAAFVGSMILMSLNYKRRKKRVMFIGNAFPELSLMQARYIVQLKDLLKKENIDDKYEIINSAIEADSLNEAFEKIEAAILDKGPDIVIVNADILESIDWFTVNRKEVDGFYKSLIKRMHDSKVNVILLAPLPGSISMNNEMQAIVTFSESYSILENIAAKHQLPFIKVPEAEMSAGAADVAVATDLCKILKHLNNFSNK